MKAFVAICVLGLALAGCAPRGQGETFMSQADMDAKDNSACISFGAQPGTQAYVDCRLRLRSDRSAEDRSRRTRAAISMLE